jgi:deoxyribodipyrimidine photo-lyase
VATDTAIVWFRQDLRLADHPALTKALDHEAVVCVYIDDQKRHGDWPLGQASRWWLSQSLAQLDQSLRERGNRLAVYAGETTAVLTELIAAHQATAVYWNRVYDPSPRDHDAKLKDHLKTQFASDQLHVESFKAQVLKEPWEMLKKDQTPYLVFTPFWKHFQATWTRPLDLPTPHQIPAAQTVSSPVTIDPATLAPSHRWTDKLAKAWQPGWPQAQQRLSEFVDDGLTGYDAARNRPDQAGTSSLSAHLHFGEISVGEVVRACEPSGQVPTDDSAVSFIREIVWREFSHYLLYHFPHIPNQPLKPVFDHFPWRSADDYQDDLAAWQAGQTGVPMVDAGMRQLNATGWMHNRVRMVVASYLTKNLLIPWQEGARYFWDTLVDADLANNTQGWQWTAGSGADASPYFRVFNPALQGEKFDPSGAYVRRWCPERGDQTNKTIHQPDPHIDLKAQRQGALDAYAQIKKGA